MDVPNPEDVRQALAPLDGMRQKIVAGMLAVMVKSPTHVHDREWVAEQLTQVTLLAGDFEADSPQAGVQAVQDFLHAHAGELLNAAYLLFQRVGLDLAPRVAKGFTFEEALGCGLTYFPAPLETVTERAPPGERELGEQPLARLMAERSLKPSDLVAASEEQITHKMVTRAMKGRRLTANTMGKVLRAWSRATESTPSQADLFNYDP